MGAIPTARLYHTKYRELAPGGQSLLNFLAVFMRANMVDQTFKISVNLKNNIFFVMRPHL